jgi:hypothetical protein
MTQKFIFNNIFQRYFIFVFKKFEAEKRIIQFSISFPICDALTKSIISSEKGRGRERERGERREGERDVCCVHHEPVVEHLKLQLS